MGSDETVSEFQHLGVRPEFGGVQAPLPDRSGLIFGDPESSSDFLVLRRLVRAICIGRHLQDDQLAKCGVKLQCREQRAAPAEAGFTKGALYSNFAGKDDLFLQLMDRQVDARLKLMDEIGEVGRLPVHEIGLILTRAALSDRDWQLLFLDYWARAVRDPSLREGFRAHRRRLHRRITEVIDQLAVRTEGGVESELSAAEVATLVLALSNGLAIEGLVDPEHLPVDLFGDVLAAVVTQTS